MTPDLRDRPVFICGHPKSGTTLLRALLDSHPQLVVYPEETVYFREFLPAAMGMTQAEKAALTERRLIHIFEWNQSQPPPHQKGFPDRDYSQISYPAVREALRSRLEAGRVRHDGDLLSAAVLAFGQVAGQLSDATRHWVEKSPYNERFVEPILSWWPQALFIHIVRDPRDNYLSYARKHPDWSSENFTASWRRSTGLGLGNQARLGADRYSLVTYERLVHEPRAVMDEIGAFLGIEDHPCLGMPSRAGVPWEGNSMFDVAYQGIGTEAVGRWEERLPAAEAGVIWLLARQMMAHLGYRPSPRVPLTAYLRTAKFNLHHLLRGSLPA